MFGWTLIRTEVLERVRQRKTDAEEKRRQIDVKYWEMRQERDKLKTEYDALFEAHQKLTRELDKGGLSEDALKDDPVLRVAVDNATAPPVNPQPTAAPAKTRRVAGAVPKVSARMVPRYSSLSSPGSGSSISGTEMLPVYAALSVSSTTQPCDTSSTSNDTSGSSACDLSI